MKENILMTIKYFDMFEFPLKKEEIWKWLFVQENKKTKKQKNKINKEEFDNKLDELINEKLVEQKDDYYFLHGRKQLVDIRKQRQEVSLKKIRKARRIAGLLGLVPGVKMIAVCSNLGYLNADEEADIDLFIVAEKDKIWLVRFWSVMLMKLLGQRPSKRTIKDKICLSYFVDENNMNLEHTKAAEPDIHLIYLLSQNLMIYREGDIWEKFIKNNGWLNDYLPNFEYTENEKRFSIKPRLIWLKKIVSKTAFGWEEKLYKKIQLKLMAPELKNMMNRGDKKVIVNDNMLKLHTNDKRDEINKKLLETYRKL